MLRVGERAVHGWTIGPVDRAGTVRREALNDVDNWDAFALYVRRLVGALDQLVTYAIDRYGRVRVAVEVPIVPLGYQPGSARKFQRLPVRDWLGPRQVAAAVLGAYPESRVVRPDRFGRRPLADYPRELRGHRPAVWGPNEARGGERDHERAAFDIAGAAVLSR